MSRNRHDTRSVSYRVVEKLAEHEGTTSTNLEPPLHSAIDPDAIDALFRTRNANADGVAPSLEFEYEGYTVRIDGPTEITIEDPAPVIV
ncbi:HalOD1 output domain-containing protein [Halobiforma nitratireducens]|uniref:Halobacterial output domain-containing protein n=1 Tax=Halobiforma nitratireducens JCM 10879 TaxID=1227454 RepID=M0LF14_9EURY|nr:HalOD1 output domain-containing protein [Halobiforma nitratireducens]EMA30565.1 hypothetical protein C446_16405 [Halobiforma nitratireducens JCM 10879]